MSRRLTTDQFIQLAKKIHNGNFDYSKAVYTGRINKIIVTSKKYGDHSILPQNHLNQLRLIKKSNSAEILTKTYSEYYAKATKEFIRDARLVHGDKYDYTKTKYIDCLHKIIITCKHDGHGDFLQWPQSHLKGHGCQKCAGNYLRNKEELISDFNKIHKNKYDYSLIEYTKMTDVIKIKCKIHGIFKKTVNHHLKGCGCKLCWMESKTPKFIEKAKKIHNTQDYDYSVTNYTGLLNKIKVKCKKHGVFEQLAGNHIRGGCCPSCHTSKGETKILNWLIANKIEFIKEKTFADLTGIKNKRYRFDFYLPTYNTCIEFDGVQHFSSIDYSIFTAEKLKDTTRIDRIKNEYCWKNSIALIRIPYTKINEIDEMLNEKILSLELQHVA
jgi:very-short-patch-repair endonuclease